MVSLPVVPKAWTDNTADEKCEILLARVNHLEDLIEGKHDPQYCDFCQWVLNGAEDEG